MILKNVSPGLSVRIPVRNGVTIIDLIDLPVVLSATWGLKGNGYVHSQARCDGRRVTRLLHREILRPTSGLVIDHASGWRADNRRCNLRPCRTRENVRNARNRKGGTSQFKAVDRRPHGRWQARIRVDRKSMILGTFASESEAARAYNEAAVRFFGEFARLNVVPANA